MTTGIAKIKKTVKSITSDIEKYLAENKLCKDTKLASTKELADKYGVSLSTIKRVFANLCNKGLIYQVQGKGTFVAKRKVSKLNKYIGYFAWKHNSHSILDEAAYGTFERRVLDGLLNLGAKVDFIRRLGFRQEILSMNDAFKYDILLIPAGMVTPSTLPMLKRLSIPIILYGDCKIHDYPFHQVCHFYDTAFEKAVKLIQEKGIKKIYIAQNPEESSEQRGNCLRKIASSMGLEHETLPFSEEQTAGTLQAIDNGRHFAQYVIENKIEGLIFSMTDFISIGFAEILDKNNIEIGKKIQLISYDNLESREPYKPEKPIFSSINHPTKILADELLELTLSLGTKKYYHDSPLRIIKVPAGKLIIRKSFQ